MDIAISTNGNVHRIIKFSRPLAAARTEGPEYLRRFACKSENFYTKVATIENVGKTVTT